MCLHLLQFNNFMRVNILVKYTPCICLLLYVSRIRLLSSSLSLSLTLSFSLSFFLPLFLLLLLSSSAASVACASTFCLTFNSFHFCTSGFSCTPSPSLHPCCSSFKIIFTCCPLLCLCTARGCTSILRVFLLHFVFMHLQWQFLCFLCLLFLFLLLHACRGMKSELWR